MGSPLSEPSRDSDETLQRVRIPRRFAIASKEVSVEQYHRFVRANPDFGMSQKDLDKYCPDHTGPMIGVSWYGAAAYCNWLSEQEGLPKDQWCYLPKGGRQYDAGMTIPADVMNRIGYRLPTEAEWEYACRSGSSTSRYYGFSTDLLEFYARYLTNSYEQVWPGGSLMPNDLGLFDMLGNVFEWCQDKEKPAIAATLGAAGANETLDEIPRILRGGTFAIQPAHVRSAYRFRLPPSNKFIYYGFRPCRVIVR
jgi:formylglycine-generating enzyme required for sulfatase activity